MGRFKFVAAMDSSDVAAVCASHNGSCSGCPLKANGGMCKTDMAGLYGLFLVWVPGSPSERSPRKPRITDRNRNNFY